MRKILMFTMLLTQNSHHDKDQTYTSNLFCSFIYILNLMFVGEGVYHLINA